MVSWKKIASGQSFFARKAGIAEWIPKERASYEAAATIHDFQHHLLLQVYQ